MIKIEHLTTAEARLLNSKQRAAYWAIPIAFSTLLLLITVLFNWWFDAPWSIFWWTSSGVFGLFFIVKIFVGSAATLHGGELKAIRTSIVLQATYKGNRPGLNRLNAGQYVEVVLEKEVLPEDHPERHAFEIFRSLGMPYYRQDESLKWRYKYLEGSEVEVEYLVHSGAVLAFRELSPITMPVYAGERVFTSLGTIHVNRRNGYNEAIRMGEVDYISIYSFNENKPNRDFIVNIRSFVEMGISFHSQAEGWDKLFLWMQKLPDFDLPAYERIKAQVGEHAEVIWLRKPTPILNNEQGFSVDILHQGLLLEDRGFLLKWSTFGQLRLMKGVRIKNAKPPNPDYRGYIFTIADPMILGGLKVAALTADTPSWHNSRKFNPTWPVTGFSADVSLAEDGLADFEKLKQHLQTLLGKPDGHSTLDTDDMVWANWVRERVTLKISTWKAPQLNQFRQGCRLEINYEPDLSRFFEDEYSSTLTLHEDLNYLVLPGALEVPSNYVQDPNTRYTPNEIVKLLAKGNQWVIWQDRRNGKVGIGNVEFVNINESKDLTGLLLVGAYWRDQPRDLLLHVVDDRRGNYRHGPENYIGKLYTGVDDTQWPIIIKQLEDFLSLPCQYVEDRQYY